MAKTKSKEPKKPYRVIKKRSGRYAVKAVTGKFINGEAKIEILVKEGIIKAMTKKKTEEAPAEGAPAAQ
jgi:hypothetical protein